MNDFWQQSTASLALQISGIIFLSAFLLYIFIKIAKNNSSYVPSKIIFIVASYSFIVSGFITMILTVLPGLMPFESHIDPNLGLGGIALFFLWPLVIAQIIIGFLIKQKINSIKLTPTLAILAFIGLFIALNIDKATIELIYN